MTKQPQGILVSSFEEWRRPSSVSGQASNRFDCGGCSFLVLIKVIFVYPWPY